VHARLGGVEGHLGSVEGRLRNLESRLGSVEGGLISLEGRLGSMESRRGGMESRITVLETKLLETKLDVGFAEICQRLDGMPTASSMNRWFVLASILSTVLTGTLITVMGVLISRLSSTG
jgi:hypothetical protein